MRVYLDYNAGAPPRAEAVAAVTAALSVRGNPSSAHREGARVRRCIEDARGQVARLLGARAGEVVLTSGATEANNLALAGVLRPGDLLVTTAVEHASVLAPAAALETRGIRVWRLGVDREARLDWDEVEAACAAGPRLVSVSLANGEVGALFDVVRLARMAHGAGALMHTDAAQAAGRLPIDVSTLGVDLLSLSSPKVGGPAGCGALWASAGIPLAPQMLGGPQERERRAGTENLLGIVGFGAAAEVASRDAREAAARMRRLRDRLWTSLHAAIAGLERNGPPDAATLPNTLNVTVPGVAAESLLVLLDLGGVAASLGSACAAGSAEPSHVLLAMGATRERARSGLRLSLGPETSDEDIVQAVTVITNAVEQIRRGAAA